MNIEKIQNLGKKNCTRQMDWKRKLAKYYRYFRIKMTDNTQNEIFRCQIYCQFWPEIAQEFHITIIDWNYLFVFEPFDLFFSQIESCVFESVFVIGRFSFSDPPLRKVVTPKVGFWYFMVDAELRGISVRHTVFKHFYFCLIRPYFEDDRLLSKNGRKRAGNRPKNDQNSD